MATRKTAAPKTRSNTRGASTKSKTRGASAKPAKRSSSRKYGAKAQAKVERSMHEMKRGELRSGGSGKKVTNPKQAIAIGLSEARREGGEVPAKKQTSRRARKTGSKSRAA